MDCRSVEKWCLHYILHGCTPHQSKRVATNVLHLPWPVAHVAALRDIVDTDCHLYLDEIADELYDRVNTRYTLPRISVQLRRDNYSLKTLHYKARQRDAAVRAQFRQRMAAYPVKCLAWLDESHVDHRSTRRRRGWARRGKRPVAFEKLDGRRFTYIGVVNEEGFIESAGRVFEHKPTDEQRGVDGDMFLEYFRTKVAPTLGNYRLQQANSVLVMDNCSIHHAVRDEVMRLARSVGAVIEFLPPYSPDYNPIEECFGQMKKSLQRHARTGWYGMGPEQAIKEAAAHISAANMVKYIGHCGEEDEHRFYRLPVSSERGKFWQRLILMDEATGILGLFT